METVKELKAELEKERDRYNRVQSRVSDYKQEYQELMVKFQREFYRGIVLEYLLRFLNDVNPWWEPEDLSKEIDINTDRFFEWWNAGRMDLIREDVEKYPIIKEVFRRRIKWGMDHPVEAGLTKGP